MITVTDAAAVKLQTLILEHPNDPVVRLQVDDLDQTRLKFQITLVSDPEEDDDVQECNGLTVAIDAGSVARIDGITVDYEEPAGFRFLHPEPGGPDLLRLINPN